MKKYILLSAIIAMASCTGSKKDNSQDNNSRADSTMCTQLVIDSMELVRKDKLLEI